MRPAKLSLTAAFCFTAAFWAAPALAEPSADNPSANKPKKEPRWVEEEYRSIRPGKLDDKYAERPDEPTFRFDFNDPKEREDEYGLERLGDEEKRETVPGLKKAPY